jgi:predicted molibdopterin-dependent oxidoreductase YjgC
LTPPRELRADPALAGARPEDPIGFSFDGAPVEAVPGQTVAAALLAAGHRTLRRTRVDDRPRGVFCGIGACFDCLVTYNGRPGMRACLTPVRDGDVVESFEGAGPPR